MNSFFFLFSVFCFCINSEFFFLFCFWWWFCGLWIATGLWPSQWRMRQMVVFTNSSLRGLEKPVAISVWDTIIYSWNSFSFCFCINFLWFMDCFVVSLLAMTKRAKGSDFFLFSVFIFTFCGLWIATGLWPSQWRRAVSSDLWGVCLPL